MTTARVKRVPPSSVSFILLITLSHYVSPYISHYILAPCSHVTFFSFIHTAHHVITLHLTLHLTLHPCSLFTRHLLQFHSYCSSRYHITSHLTSHITSLLLVHTSPSSVSFILLITLSHYVSPYISHYILAPCSHVTFFSFIHTAHHVITLHLTLHLTLHPCSLFTRHLLQFHSYCSSRYHITSHLTSHITSLLLVHTSPSSVSFILLITLSHYISPYISHYILAPCSHVTFFSFIHTAHHVITLHLTLHLTLHPCSLFTRHLLQFHSYCSSRYHITSHLTSHITSLLLVHTSPSSVSFILLITLSHYVSPYISHYILAPCSHVTFFSFIHTAHHVITLHLTLHLTLHPCSLFTRHLLQFHSYCSSRYHITSHLTSHITSLLLVHTSPSSVSFILLITLSHYVSPYISHYILAPCSHVTFFSFIHTAHHVITLRLTLHLTLHPCSLFTRHLLQFHSYCSSRYHITSHLTSHITSLLLVHTSPSSVSFILLITLSHYISHYILAPCSHVTFFSFIHTAHHVITLHLTLHLTLHPCSLFTRHLLQFHSYCSSRYHITSHLTSHITSLLLVHTSPSSVSFILLITLSHYISPYISHYILAPCSHVTFFSFIHTAHHVITLHLTLHLTLHPCSLFTRHLLQFHSYCSSRYHITSHLTSHITSLLLVHTSPSSVSFILLITLSHYISPYISHYILAPCSHVTFFSFIHTAHHVITLHLTLHLTLHPCSLSTRHLLQFHSYCSSRYHITSHLTSHITSLLLVHTSPSSVSFILLITLSHYISPHFLFHPPS